MSYQLQLQKIYLQIEETEDTEQIKKLLKEAIEIADKHNDFEEQTNLRLEIIDYEDNTDLRLAWLKQTITLADNIQDKQMGFNLRKDLILEEVMHKAKCTDSFTAMTWLLDAIDNSEGLFKEEEALWEYKWLAVSAIEDSTISHEQIENILSDLELRLKKAGYGLGAYYVPKINWLVYKGEIKKALKLLEERDAYGRDGMSDCEACEQSLKIEVNLKAKRYKEAIGYTQELERQNLSCAEVPFITYTRLACHLRKKFPEKAEEYYQKSKEIKAEEFDESNIGQIADLIYYAAYHYPEVALDYFQKYAHWLLEADDETIFNSSLRFLPLFKEDKTLHMPKLNLNLPYYNPEGQYQTQALFAYYKQQAQEIGERFDARNRSRYFSEIIEKELKTI